MSRQWAPAVAGAGILVRLFVAVLVGSGRSASRGSDAAAAVDDDYACDVIVTSSPNGERPSVTIGAGAAVPPRNASAVRLTLRSTPAAAAGHATTGPNGSRTPLPRLPQLRRVEVDVTDTRSFPAGLLSQLGATSVQQLSVFRSASTDADYRLRLPVSSAESPTFAASNGSLSKLVLSDLGIEEIPPNTFDGLTTLRHLSVNINRLSSLPAGLFDDLCRLSSLSLTQNRFVDVEDMSLTGNGQTEPLPRCGGGVARLRTLNLYGNRLRRLRAGVFRWLPSVVELNLSGNELSVVDAGAFSGLAQLRTLYVDDNHLVDLVPAMFDGLAALTTLDVGDNRLSDVASGVFQNLTELRTLRLRANEIRTVGAGAWSGLDQLTSLDLAANRLAAVDRSTFVGLCNLRRLDLSDNEMTAVPADAFACLTSLQALDLRGNPLSDAERRRTDERRWWLNDADDGAGPAVCDRCANSSTTAPAETDSLAGRHDIPPGPAIDRRTSPSPSSSAAVRMSASRMLAAALAIGAVVVALFLTLAAATHLRRRRRAVFDCHQRSHSVQNTSYGPHSGTACTLDNSVEGLYVKYRI